MPRATPRSLAIPVAAIAVGLACAVLLAGCPSKKPKTPACGSDEDCKNGLVCINKECKEKPVKAECTKDDDCGDGKVCLGGKCQKCASDDQCGPGGKCQAGACERPKKCSKDDDCADDEDCIDGVCQKPWQQGAGGPACPLSPVYFAFDDASIQASERDRLDGNASCIGKTKGKNVYLVGHTDPAGTEEYNIALSERRGQTVADYLARLGVDPARLQVVPKGETEPSGQGDEKDRRVEFQWR